MAITQNLYTGNGSTTNYSFTFPYLEETDVKVSLDGVDTTAYTFANATTIKFNTAPANGVAIRIYRQTDDSDLSATFYSGSAIRSQDLNDNFTQNLYVTQEARRDVANAVAGQIPDGTIGTSKLADGAVTDAKVTSVGSAKTTFTQSGTGAVQRTVESKLKDIVSVKDFGAVGDGVADDTVAIQAAIDAASAGSTVVFPTGTYIVSSPVNVTTSNLTIDLGAAVIDGSTISGPYVQATPKACFDVHGSLRGSTTLSANAAVGASTITVSSSANIQPGDLVQLRSASELWYTESTNVVSKTEINRVQAVSGTTVTLSEPLRFSYDTGVSSVTVNAWNPVRNVQILGGSFYGGGYKESLGNGLGPAAFHVRYFDGVTLRPVYVEGFQGFVVRFNQGANANFTDSTIRGYKDEYNTPVVEGSGNSGFYGVYFHETLHGTMSNVACYRLRHAQDGSRSSGVVVDNVRAWGGHRPPLGCHAGCVDFIYSNCYVQSQLGGIQWRGHSFSAIGCTIDCSAGSATTAIYDTVGTENDIPRTVVLSGNTCIAKRHAVSLVANIKQYTISGGYYESLAAGYATIPVYTLDLDTLHITGATIVSGGLGCVRAEAATPRTRSSIVVTGCTLRDAGTNASVRVLGTTASDPTSLIVKDNYISGSTALSDVLGGTNMRHFVEGPNYRSDGRVFGQGTPQKVLSADYTVAMEDMGKLLVHPSSDNNARTFTIPSNTAAPIPVGSVFEIFNDAATALTIAINTDQLYAPDIGAGSFGSRTLADNGTCTIKKVLTNRWVITGNQFLT